MDEIQKDLTFTSDNIPFLREGDILEPVHEEWKNLISYRYCVHRGSERFFLKVKNVSYAQNWVEKIMAADKICRKLDITPLICLEHGDVLNMEGYHYFVYNFLEGDNLRSASKARGLSITDNYRYGRLAAEKLLRLKDADSRDKETFEFRCAKEQTEQVVRKLDELLADAETRDVLFAYFGSERLRQIKEELYRYSAYVDAEPMVLVHGDFSRTNVMIDDKGDLAIVDFDGMGISYDVYNAVGALCSYDNKYERSFSKGFFDAIYQNKRPNDFNKTIIWQYLAYTFYAMHEYAYNYKLMDYYCSMAESYSFWYEQYRIMDAAGLNIV